MTLNEWIEQYCQENEIELPEDIADGDTALNYLILNAGGGGGSVDYITKPTANDVGKVMQVNYGSEPDSVIISETVITVEDGTATPNPIPNANVNLFNSGTKVIFEINGTEYEATILYDGETGFVVEIGDDVYSGIYKEDDELYFWCDIDGSYTIKLSRANAIIDYVPMYDIELENNRQTWTSHYTYSQLDEKVINGETLTARVKILKNTSSRQYRGYLTSDIYFYKLEGVDYIMCAYRSNIFTEIGSDSFALKPDGTYEYYD